MMRIWKIAAAGFVSTSIMHACGGRVDYGPPGTLDDSGTFTAPDGKVAFAPGSACVGYDASRSLDYTSHAPSCSGVQDASALCSAWIEDAGLSFGFPPSVGCNNSSGDGATCEFSGAGAPWNQCTFGPSGDAYCSAFFQQFVVGDKKAQYRCIRESPLYAGACSPAGPCPHEYKYSQSADGSFTVTEALDAGSLLTVWVVTPDGTGTCEPICTP